MEWFKQAVSFWKLAVEDEEKKEYDRELFQLKHLGTIYMALNYFIVKWVHKPYFSWEEMQEIFDKFVGTWARGSTATGIYVRTTDEMTINRNIPEDLKKKWINEFTEAYLEFKVVAGINRDGITSNDYLQMEKLYHLLKPELREKAKKVMLLNLHLRLYQMLNESENDDEKEVDARDFTTIQMFRTLYQSSMHLPKDELRRAIKQMGPDNYGIALQGSDLDLTIDKLLAKKELSEYDLALLLNKRNATFLTADEFRKIIDKANQNGKEYLRRFLYFVYGSENRYFMLDEEMKPMGHDYSKVDVPTEAGITVTRFSSAPIAVQQMWGPIFAEFKMMTN